MSGGPASRPPDPLLRLLSAVALVGIVANAAALVAMPLLRPDVNLLRASLSHYAVGPHGRIQTFAFGALGIACLALSAAVPRAVSRRPATWVASLLLVVAGVGMVALAAVPMGVPQPHTPLGDVHQTAGTIAVVAQFGALAALLLAVRNGPEWASLRRVGLMAGLVAFVAASFHQLAIWYPTLGVPEGVTIRVVTVVMLWWWAAVARSIEAASGDVSDVRTGPVRRSGAAR